ncbi:DMT family transporter [Jiulongibacter sediminis]|jgi:drug/metabolite transporter (DMT)-like permease|uniref:DMT family transporter n=1 Tax=Jiulongibacter sediminis TaxID=1605367 RepID=UPI0026EB0673|nr:DMT family transporter [Jiulongibacter sediminis]
MLGKQFSDYALLHSMIILLGLTAILGKLITLPALDVVLYRSMIASAAFAILVSLKKQKQDWSSLLPILSVGAILGIHWICFFGSAKLSNVSVSLITVSTTAFFTSIIEPLSQRKKIEMFDVLLGLLVILGMTLIFFAIPKHGLAILIGLLAGFLSTIYVVANARLIQRHSALKLNTIELTGAFLICLPVLPFIKSAEMWALPQNLDLIYLLVLALLCTVLPYMVNLNLLKKFTAFEMNLAINLEPVYGILMAWVIFKEEELLNVRFYIGAGLILLSLLLYGNKKALTKRKGL